MARSDSDSSALGRMQIMHQSTYSKSIEVRLGHKPPIDKSSRCSRRARAIGVSDLSEDMPVFGRMDQCLAELCSRYYERLPSAGWRDSCPRCGVSAVHIQATLLTLSPLFC